MVQEVIKMVITNNEAGAIFNEFIPPKGIDNADDDSIDAWYEQYSGPCLSCKKWTSQTIKFKETLDYSEPFEFCHKKCAEEDEWIRKTLIEDWGDIFKL